jgi:hypothetical protein
MRGNNHYAQALALAGFITGLVFSDYWRGHPMLGLAMILMLVAIPMYVGVLTSRLDQMFLEREADLQEVIALQ